MNILFIGDIVGRPGRHALKENLQRLIHKFQLELVVANVENAAAGFGVTPEIADEFLNDDVDVLTSGNHVYDKKEILDYIGLQPRLLRPANYPVENPGAGSYVGFTKTGVKIGVLQVQGRVFMPPNDFCPFKTADREIGRLRKETNVIVVDFHGEATSEKVAFGWHVDGRVSAVFGTHTHIQTADERILPKGTAYITDVGMTGPYESVIGMGVKESLERMMFQMPRRLEPAKGDPRVSGAVVTVDRESGRAQKIERIHIRESKEEM